jgi:ergothioneine biosynthesis protein EgtB
MTAWPQAAAVPIHPPQGLAARLQAVRAQSLALAAPLSPEDCQAQSMPDASPIKWHLAHTTWFFETLVLERFEPGFRPFHPAFRVLFNSYYNAVGDKHPRPQRGLLTRPTLAEVMGWRAQVDERLATLMQGELPADALALLELGLQHEQQHQELMLTDAKHLLAANPLQPVYAPGWPLAPVQPQALGWLACEGGLHEIGHAGAGFAFDNEGPRHRVWLAPYALASRHVTHGDWAEFVADGGYREPRWWLSAGWDWVQAQGISLPLYWQADGAGFSSFTLHGRVPIDPHTPVTHLSFWEAEAYCRWRSASDSACRGARLPTEAEWEAAVAPREAAHIAAGHFVDNQALHPMPRDGGALPPWMGDVWAWTRSAYEPYPGYTPWAGAVGEYNGKFMANQFVLRGGSCATPRAHIRASYRNFFPADARWQFSGLLMARDEARDGARDPGGS